MGCFDGTVLSRIRLILIIIILHVLSRKAYVESFSFNRASSLLLSSVSLADFENLFQGRRSISIDLLL